VVIVTIQNEEMPGAPGARPPYIQARRPDGQPFCWRKQDFIRPIELRHEVSYDIDGLAYMHYGVEAVEESAYFSLFVYSDGLQITSVEEVL
jgi:hypothetical protein